MQQRRLGRTGHPSSVLIFGGAALGAVGQDEADRAIESALGAGINHFDVAANYGDAELRLGPWMPRIRRQVFLATKTQERAEDAAWAQINRSLERLRTDSVDLLQLHAVGDREELDRATRRGGALDAAVRARDEGMARFVGITGHGHEAPATHREALDRFPFDTVLTPLNPVLDRDPAYRAAYAALVEEVRRQDAGLMTIKTVSRRNWPESARGRYATWYEPFDEQAYVTATVVWVLSHREVSGIPTAGDVRLLPLMYEAVKHVGEMSPADALAVLDGVAGYSSPFLDMPA
jgi:aryl-alcohol dehydrogenase-like predicted oxidoreductase